ncbi:MAG TPA: exodeoxyribonuclease VII large subunit [Spirochaetota bacterium]|nr:exodeoxyribonuclease VII large subunit [Spirochaetota bacterium]HPP04574.1 exodeoxyribonuclease VII large subunit [Spirochaetota bacterium]
MKEKNNINKYLSVSDFTHLLKYNLETSYPNVYLRGEISNFKPNLSGHWFFVLKDNGASIRAIVFRNIQPLVLAEFNNNISEIKDGKEVLVDGRIQLYEKNGEYSVVISKMIPLGIGELAIKFEMLKKKLEEEGLFDPATKKDIPKYPETIGIITSPNAAALQDILRVLSMRYKGLNIIVFPASVQGEEAKYEIVKAIECANYHYRKNTEYKVDLLILARGGGSIEDLWAFNEEIVARAIKNSDIPIITGIGHEIDFTIADFCADLRAPTPSAAAEIAIRQRNELLNNIRAYKLRISSYFNYFLDNLFSRYSNSSVERLIFYMTKIYENNLQNFSYLKENLLSDYDNLLQKYRHTFDLLTQKLDNLSPLKNLSRGYSIVLNNENKVITDSNDVKKEEILKIILNKGEILTEVKEIIK